MNGKLLVNVSGRKSASGKRTRTKNKSFSTSKRGINHPAVKVKLCAVVVRAGVLLDLRRTNTHGGKKKEKELFFLKKEKHLPKDEDRERGGFNILTRETAVQHNIMCPSR